MSPAPLPLLTDVGPPICQVPRPISSQNGPLRKMNSIRSEPHRSRSGPLLKMRNKPGRPRHATLGRCPGLANLGLPETKGRRLRSLGRRSGLPRKLNRVVSEPVLLLLHCPRPRRVLPSYHGKLNPRCCQDFPPSFYVLLFCTVSCEFDHVGGQNSSLSCGKPGARYIGSIVVYDPPPPPHVVEKIWNGTKKKFLGGYETD